jgi:hypothetical protein
MRKALIPAYAGGFGQDDPSRQARQSREPSPSWAAPAASPAPQGTYVARQGHTELGGDGAAEFVFSLRI